MRDVNEPDVATLRARRAIRVLATPEMPTPSTFIVGRWPATYAYDQVRVRKPGVVDSRGAAAGFIRNLAGEAGLPVRFVQEMLATAYCIENNIELPIRRQ